MSNFSVPSSSMPPAQPVRKDTEMSRRNYIALMSLLIAAGFAVVAVGGIVMSDPAIGSIFPAASSLSVAIVSLVVCIVGFVIQWQSAKQKNPTLALIGYALISITLGVLTAWTLQYYDIGTITAAFIGTVVIAVSFGALGYIFPSFFEKIHTILVVCLLAMIIVEIVLMVAGVSQGVTDWIVLAIFCGFIGYDFYQAMHVEHTKINAILYATNIYLDLVNVFVRLLSILGNRD